MMLCPQSHYENLSHTTFLIELNPEFSFPIYFHSYGLETYLGWKPREHWHSSH